jgi:hypothetical protein
MSQTDPQPAELQPENPPVDWEEQSKQSMQALGNVVERISPWLIAFGSWIFGGLIGFNLLIIGSLITVGPIDPAILVSMTAFAAALPLNLAGLLLLKLVQEMKDIHIDEEMFHAFQEAGFPIELYVPPAQERASLYNRRTDTALRYSLTIMAFSVALTLIGMISALWYMAWWIGVVFLVMAIVSQVLVVLVVIHSLPPESQAEKDVKKVYKKYMSDQKEGHSKKIAQDP